MPEEDDMDFLRLGVTNFISGYTALQKKWQSKLSKLKDSGSKVVIWGSGSKGVSFICNLDLGDELVAAVDINPHKWGKYMVGSNHKIISPEELSEINPDLVVAMNPIYLDEIGEELKRLGISAELTAV